MTIPQWATKDTYHADQEIARLRAELTHARRWAHAWKRCAHTRRAAGKVNGKIWNRRLTRSSEHVTQLQATLEGMQCQANVLLDVYAAAQAWRDALSSIDGVVAAEQRLRAAVEQAEKGL